MTKLTSVALQNNECIKENFNDPSEISSMPSAVDKKCGFCEINIEIQDLDSCKIFESQQLMLDTQNTQLEFSKTTQTEFKALLKSQYETLKGDVTAVRNEITKKSIEEQKNLNDILGELKAYKSIAEDTQAIVAELKALLKSQQEAADKRNAYRNDTFVLRNAELN